MTARGLEVSQRDPTDVETKCAERAPTVDVINRTEAPRLDMPQPSPLGVTLVDPWDMLSRWLSPTNPSPRHRR